MNTESLHSAPLVRLLILAALIVGTVFLAGQVNAAGGPLVTGLPFAVGETWNFAQNFHGGVNAMDFGTTTGMPGQVLAADSGVVIFAEQTCAKIKRADGVVLGYQHLEPNDIANLKRNFLNKTVMKGQFLGMTTGKWTNRATGCNGTSDGNTVHFWAEGAARLEVGSVIGGFTVGSICGNAPSLNKNGVKYCPISRITYTETEPTPIPIPTPIPTRPPTVFKNGVSTLWQDQSWRRANLKVCADNLNGNTVNVIFNRDGRSWTYSQRATSNCVTFWDMDGAGPLNRSTTYYSRAALNQQPSPSWPVPCAGATGSQGLCDTIRRP